ncbi:hypothetical protein ACJMK2_011615 [Sinanodonta woodiana]|uniref:Uncharacterized protein n=1 Tax=Sinanodonta woodiana TaxID=1069815 RepID=A0ABD3V5N8_SINWO
MRSVLHLEKELLDELLLETWLRLHLNVKKVHSLETMEKKMKGKATSAKCQMANKKKRKHKEDIKVKCVKKKSISKNPDTTRVKKMKGKATKAKCQIDKKRKGKRKANGKAKSVKKKSISKNPDSNKSSLKEAYQSIESLTLSQRSCKIRARLTMKSEVGSKRKKITERRFSPKKYFQFKVIDKSGEIEGFAYDDAVDKFYGVLKMGKVFCIRATLKKAKKKFNSTRHDCQIVLNKDACIKPCEDTSDIPRYGIFAFKTIDELKDLRPGELVGKFKRFQNLKKHFNVTVRRFMSHGGDINQCGD